MPRPTAFLLLLLAPLGAVPARAANWSPLPTGFERVYHRAIYDSLRSRMLVFGGVDSLYRNDVHQLTLSGSPAWSVLSPSGFPAPDVRDNHGLVYDPVRDRMLVFGGAKMFGATVVQFNDVWAMSLASSPAWTQILPTGSKPAARHGHNTVYDPVRDRLIVFGGRDVTGLRNDVWQLSLSGTPAWTLLVPSGTPPTARDDAAAIYDPVRDRMIVFGGFGPTWNSDVWELTFSPLAWNPITPAAAGPSARDRLTGIYDPLNDRMVVFGGRDGPLHWTNDVWGLSLGGTPGWLDITPSGGSAPAARWGYSAAYDAADQQLVIFGGSAATGTYFDDAWALTLGPAVSVDGAPHSRLLVVAAGPNPALEAWTLQFRLAEPAEVSVRIYDTAGRVVRDLGHEALPAGSHALRWELRSDSGRRVPNGVYFFELRGAGLRLGKALVVVDQ